MIGKVFLFQVKARLFANIYRKDCSKNQFAD